LASRRPNATRQFGRLAERQLAREQARARRHPIETSLAISLRLIEASKALLAQADVLDDVQKRMQESEAGLKDVRERLLQD
jgi:uncharacterized protein with WD repeat